MNHCSLLIPIISSLPHPRTHAHTRIHINKHIAKYTHTCILSLYVAKQVTYGSQLEAGYSINGLIKRTFTADFCKTITEVLNLTCPLQPGMHVCYCHMIACVSHILYIAMYWIVCMYLLSHYT